jgi:hypothetical protein
MEYHMNGLKKACRVCGGRLYKAKGRQRCHLVEEHKEELAEVFNIDVSRDSEDTHPLSFCQPCRAFMASWHSRGGNAPAVGRVSSCKWKCHSEPQCMVRARPCLPLSLSVYVNRQVCQYFEDNHRDGGHKSKSGIGRPKKNTPKELISRLTQMAPTSFFPALPFSIPPPTAHNTIGCAICLHYLDRPIELGCGELVCLLCCTKWLTTDDRGQCPCCYNPLSDHASSPSRITMDFIGRQMIDCNRGCNKTVRLDHFMQHIASKCQSHYEHSTHSPSRTTYRDFLDKDKESPTTATERQMAGKVIRRLMAETKDSPILQLPTRGQVRKHRTHNFH